jgi:hypothetical protein
LDSVPHNLAGDTTRPAHGRFVEAFALPVIGVSACGVHRGFEATGQGFAELITRHQQTLAMRGACLMEFELPLIRLVVVEPVLRPPSVPFRC